YSELIDRVEGVHGLLGASERPLAERVVALARELARRPRDAGRLVPGESDADLKKELGRLTEQLGRRASAALPAATLGRAALADLHGDVASLLRLCADGDTKLALLGH